MRAVLAQRGAPPFELLVIDQSADDATRHAVARAVADAGPERAVLVEYDAGRDGRAHPEPLPESERAQEIPRVVRVRSHETGRSRALNAGWPLARGEWVAIIDDDCEPEPDWLAWLDAEARRAGPRDVVAGRVMPGPIPPGKAFPPATLMDPLPAEYAGRIDRDLVHPNIALPRGVFEEIGPFDPRLGVGTPLPGGEDNDFGYRLLRASWRILYRPAPTVVHRAWRSEEERATLKRSYGIGQGAFYAKHLAAADTFIGYRFARDVLRTARAAAGAAVRGRGRESRGHLAFLRGLFGGAWKMSVLMARYGRTPGNEPALPRAIEDRARVGGAAVAVESVGAGAGGRMVEMELAGGKAATRSVMSPALGEDALAYVLFRWKGRPVGRLLIERGREPSPSALRSAAFEASAAGILVAEIERSGRDAGAVAGAAGDVSAAPATVPASAPAIGPVSAPATGPAPAPGSPADALRLAALLDLDAPIGRVARTTAGQSAEGDRAAAAPRSSAIPAASEISVVIATRDRPGDLAACLAALRALEPPPGEIVVADSASRDATAVASVVRGAGARLVRLEKPGLSRARNAGAAAASGSVLAFLDDDCRVDPGYLDDLRAGFSDDGVWAVTGLLLPLDIDTEAQRLFLRYSHMDLRGFLPRRFDRAARPSRHWPIDAWRMGSGGNLAVRASRFAQLGGFRAALGLGTPARGGEDLFLLWSVVHGGGAVVYRPGAMARHRHHRSMDALHRLLFGYGAGHAAYLRAARRAGATPRTVRFYRMSFYADRTVRIARSLLGRWPVPASLVLRELRGSLAGGRLARRAEREAAQEAAEAARDAQVTAAPKWTS